MSDEQNPASLTKAFLACKASLTRYVATFFVSREDIEDTVQEAYLKSLIAQKDTEIQSPKAYLFSVARNIALTKKRRQKKIFEENVGEFEDSIAIVNEAGPEEQVHAQDKLRAFCEAVDALPPQCRKVFLMQRMDGLTYKEIAKRLGISTRTVENHLRKALVRCAEHLSAKGFADEGAISKVENIEAHRRRRR